MALKDVVEVRTARNAKVEEILSSHAYAAQDLLRRQQLEAVSLAALQSTEIGKNVESVGVSGDFFEEAFAAAKRDMTQER